MTRSSCYSARVSLLEKKKVPQSKFLPPGRPDFYIPRSSISRVLQDHPVRDIFLCDCEWCRKCAGVVADVDDRGPRFDESELLGEYATIFALLIYVDHPGLIHRFRRERVTLDGTHFLAENDLRFLFKLDVLDKRAAQSLQDEILLHQYKFQVRKLELRNEETTIRAEEVFPIDEEPAREGRGDFGEVFAFSIQHDEYRGESFKAHQITRFARKIFQLKDYKAAAKEWVNLLQVNQIEHKHLMPALGAFWHGDYFFILFEYAAQTLHKFLHSDGTSFTPKELWEQVQGLAHGLAYLHGYDSNQGDVRKIAYHLDLKPANVLIVNGIMKIADFGISQFKIVSPQGESGSSGVEDRWGPRPYAPPGDGHLARRGNDIWSLGAIISEIATFDIQKAGGLAEYRQDRKTEVEEGKFYGSNCFHRNGKMKDAVSNRHKTLLNLVEKSNRSENRARLDPWQEQFFHQDFFTMIEEMLAPVRRPQADEVARRLGAFHVRAASTRTGRRHPLPNIWEETLAGTIPESPQEDSDRL
ncbi:MAG: hypothetical protein M1816_006610 [Peltula sp. TS41687]|nr:MAG: hypothetical protein M1816_006610 [Peltula sp. TS41687]